MIRLSLVGIGTGSVDHLTHGAVKALNHADLILIPNKGAAKSDLAELRRKMLDEVLSGHAQVVEFDLPERAADGDYLDRVNDWHDAIARAWQALIAQHLPRGGRVALMIWGDPSLYDSSLRIAARLGDGVTVEVIPGITSLQALTAAHGITLNSLGAPVLITTARQLRAQGWPDGVDSVAVMLDSGGGYDALGPSGIHIWWGANLGLPEQCLIAGPLAEVADRITQTRTELRARHGWVMDIYLLRRG